jgi:hypothetical protein
MVGLEPGPFTSRRTLKRWFYVSPNCDPISPELAVGHAGDCPAANTPDGSKGTCCWNGRAKQPAIVAHQQQAISYEQVLNPAHSIASSTKSRHLGSEFPDQNEHWGIVRDQEWHGCE